MAEIFTEVKTFTVDYACDDCEGEVKAEDYYHPTAPVIYPHRCIECERKYKFSTRYPKTVYRSV